MVLPRGAAPRTFPLSTGRSAVELEEDGCQTPVMLRTEPAYETDRVAGRLAYMVGNEGNAPLLKWHHRLGSHQARAV